MAPPHGGATPLIAVGVEPHHSPRGLDESLVEFNQQWCGGFSNMFNTVGEGMPWWWCGCRKRVFFRLLSCLPDDRQIRRRVVTLGPQRECTAKEAVQQDPDVRVKPWWLGAGIRQHQQ